MASLVQKNVSFWTMLVNLFFSYGQYSFPLVYFSVVCEEYGLKQYHTGLIYALYSCGSIFILILIMFCQIREKVSVIKLIILFESISVLAAILMGLSTCFKDKLAFCLIASLSRFCEGLGQGGLASINYSYIMILRPDDIQSNVTKYELLTCLGYTFGPQLGVFLLRMFHSYLYINLVLAAILLFFGCLQIYCFIAYNLESLDENNNEEGTEQEQKPEVSRKPSCEIVTLILMLLSIYLSFSFPTSEYSAYLKFQLNYSDFQVGLLYSLMGIGYILGTITFMTKFFSKQKLRKLFILLGQFCAGLFLFTTVSQDSLGMPSTKQLIFPSNFLLGYAQSFTMILFVGETISLYEQMGQKGQKINDLAANLNLFMLNFGELLGTPLGGVFFYFFGFVNGIDIFILITLPLSLFYLIKFMNFRNNEESNQKRDQLGALKIPIIRNSSQSSQ